MARLGLFKSQIVNHDWGATDNGQEGPGEMDDSHFDVFYPCVGCIRALRRFQILSLTAIIALAAMCCTFPLLPRA